MATNSRVLFNWKPRVLNHALGERFKSRLARAGIETRGLVEVRSPRQNADRTSAIRRWHQDSALSGTQLIVWSNVRPTMVRFNDDSILESHDGDVILIDNDEVLHRAPDSQKGRWFIRAVKEIANA